MKLIADTHAHTIASGHAYSTMREMVRSAAEKGMELLALTEHAPKMPGSCPISYFRNLKVVPREMEGIQLLLGTEANIMDADGNLDVPEDLCRSLDIVIASMHFMCYSEKHTKEENTKAYLNVMEKPYVNVIGHPDDSTYPVDIEAFVKKAKETGTLIEINNSSLRPDAFRKNCFENMSEILKMCRKYGAYVTTSSDAHVDVDSGNLCYVQKILAECDFPEELVVTADLKKLYPYLNKYKR